MSLRSIGSVANALVDDVVLGWKDQLEAALQENAKLRTRIIELEHEQVRLMMATREEEQADA